MIKAILYKEWIKTKRIVFMSMLAFATALVYIFICVNQTIRVEGIKQLITSSIVYNINVVSILTFIPLLVGMAIALYQFVTEMTDKRLKLTLHLPVAEWKILLSMLGFGASIMLFFSIVSVATLFIGLRIILPYEIVMMNIITAIPWMLAGISAYFLTAWICFEPTWKGRAVEFVIALSFISIYVYYTTTGVMITMIPYLVAMTIIAGIFPCFSVTRFKDGIY